MEKDHDRKGAHTNSRCNPIVIAKCLGVYSILVTIICAVLIALLVSTMNKNKALQQEMSSHGFDSDDSAVVEMQAKFDRCILSKDILKEECRVATEQLAATEESNALIKEIDARLNSSLIAMQNRNSDLNASNVECFRSNVELERININMKAQVDSLEASVVEMNETIQSYTILTDRMTEEKDRLERSKDILSERVGEMNASNAQFAMQVTRLNESLAEARIFGEDMKKLNDHYADQNAVLNRTVLDLTTEVGELEVLASGLNATAQEFVRQNGILSVNVDRLENINGNLTLTVSDLNGTVDDLRLQNARLSELNNDLRKIVSFLNEVANGVEESYDSISAYLAGQISQSRGLLIEILANTYRQMTYYWICSANSRFWGRTFMSNPDSPLGSDTYLEIVEYINDILFTDLCFDLSDFERFVIAATGAGQYPSGITWSELKSFVADYIMEGVNYYFPSLGQSNGLMEEDWADAGYVCEGLTADKQYRF